MNRPEVWLVEEHRMLPFGDAREHIEGHWVVVLRLDEEIAFLDRAKLAFKAADRLARAARDTKEDEDCFFFASEELQEWQPGYCAAAADGSSVAYEVRFVGRIMYDVAGNAPVNVPVTIR